LLGTLRQEFVGNIGNFGKYWNPKFSKVCEMLNSQKSTANLVGLDRSELKPENDFLKESAAIYTQKVFS